MTGSPIDPQRRALVLTALAAGAAAACRPVSGPLKVRIGYQKAGVLLLAWARGGIEDALKRLGPISVEWVQFVAGPPMLEAMRAGAIDIGAVGDTPPIFAQAAGAPIVYAAAVPNADAAEAVITPAASSIRTLRDIKGARVGLTKGSSLFVSDVVYFRCSGIRLALARQADGR